MAELQKFRSLFVLFAITAGTLALGISHKQPLVLFGFAAWLAIECIVRFLRKARRAIENRAPENRSPFPTLRTYYSEWSPSSIMLLEEELARLKSDRDLNVGDRRELERFADIIELRKLITVPQSTSKNKLRQAFVLHTSFERVSEKKLFEKSSTQDLIESATLVAHLYRKVWETTENPLSYYRAFANSVLRQSIPMLSEQNRALELVERLTDQIQQDGGITFLVLNLIHSNCLEDARTLTQRLLKEDWNVDDDLKSSLYWFTELIWFSREMQTPIAAFESTMRYLYHICFAAPERAQFLEIDSRYFSQFETVNELAREAFLFKENLINRFLELWGTQEGFFDAHYKEVLEVMTQLKSKIYDDRTVWQRTWNREEEHFSKDYLYVVEGNLSYAAGHFEDARGYYEKALKENPNLRPALLNSVFAYAKLGETELHEWMCNRIVNLETLIPSNLYVAGNSCTLMGKEKKADGYYSQLSQIPGWEGKTFLYRSTFCYENGLVEKALLYARLAEREQPEDPTVLYHLSVCYSSVGEKERALEIVRKLGDRPHWMDYYRFTLERDSGKSSDAVQTLLTMPPGYFDDPEELEAALDFAKSQEDLQLLRHLRKRK